MTLKPLHNRHDWKIEEFPSSFPLSLIVDWRERDRINSSGLECEAYLVHFKGIKCESRWIKSKVCDVCEWFDGCDRLKIIFKS